jgi:hypothetical protein
MNFEFKSTFKIISARSKALIRKTIRTCIRHYLLVVLMINLSALILAVYFYLENLFLPAVYGSKSSGILWIRLFSFLAFAWIVTTTYALMALLAALPFVRKITQAIHAVVEPKVEKYLPVLTFLFIRMLLFLSAAIYLVNRKQKSLGIMFNPKYHNHESEADPSGLG